MEFDPNTRPPLNVLLVEDNLVDIILFKEALEEIHVNCELQVARDGEEALRGLRGECGNFVRPDLIFLDLNLPKKNGLQVLQEIKADSELRTIPIVVLTTSKSLKDTSEAYRLHAISYIVKPRGIDAYIEFAEIILKYWGALVVRPQSLK